MSDSNKPGRGRIYSSIVETIGNTPLVRADKFARENGVVANLLVKLEFCKRQRPYWSGHD